MRQQFARTRDANVLRGKVYSITYVKLDITVMLVSEALLILLRAQQTFLYSLLQRVHVFHKGLSRCVGMYPIKKIDRYSHMLAIDNHERSFSSRVIHHVVDGEFSKLQ